MKITQHFTWEASHRHFRRALHRHAYRLTVELESSPVPEQAAQVVQQVVSSLVDTWRDAVLVASHDEPLQHEVEQQGRKHAIVPGETTAEALSRYVVDYFCMMAAPRLRSYGVEAVQVRVDGAASTTATEEEHGFARAYLRADRYGSAKWARAAA